MNIVDLLLRLLGKRKVTPISDAETDISFAQPGHGGPILGADTTVPPGMTGSPEGMSGSLITNQRQMETSAAGGHGGPVKGIDTDVPEDMVGSPAGLSPKMNQRQMEEAAAAPGHGSETPPPDAVDRYMVNAGMGSDSRQVAGGRPVDTDGLPLTSSVSPSYVAAPAPVKGGPSPEEAREIRLDELRQQKLNEDIEDVAGPPGGPAGTFSPPQPPPTMSVGEAVQKAGLDMTGLTPPATDNTGASQPNVGYEEVPTANQLNRPQPAPDNTLAEQRLARGREQRLDPDGLFSGGADFGLGGPPENPASGLGADPNVN